MSSVKFTSYPTVFGFSKIIISCHFGSLSIMRPCRFRSNWYIRILNIKTVARAIDQSAVQPKSRISHLFAATITCLRFSRCLGKSTVSIRTFLNRRWHRLRGRQYARRDEKEGTRSGTVSSWWWQYKARRVSGLSQSVERYLHLQGPCP